LIPRYLLTLIWVLLFGLIIHFIWINFLQFIVGIGKPWISIISLWKEFVIWIMIILVMIYNIKQYWLKGWLNTIKNDKYFRYLCIGFAILVFITACSSLINGSFGKAYIIAFRYNFVPFILLLLWYLIAQIISYSDIKRITNNYASIIKWIIWFALIWYFVISTLPGALRIFWYDRHVFEGKMWEQPPAVYYAALDHGAPRNQFLRERPIYFGFYLVAFRPFFFFIYLRRASKTEQLFYGWLFILAVFTTFSRSARWVWVLETALMFFLLYGRKAMKYLKYIAIPLIWLGFLVGTYFYYEIFWPGRNFSNTGHINAFFDSITILEKDWLWWKGAGSAWPASHQLWMWFNPENQYLQIRIEYGIFGFLVRLLFYWALNLSWMISWWWNKAKSYFQDSDIRHRDMQRLILLSCNIGLISLSLCGLVLHSLADKMVIWPLMLIYGMWLWVKIADKN
jgi:hypothetical protein